MSARADNGYIAFGDGSTLGTGNVPWANIYGKPSIVPANTKYNGNETIGRGIYSGNNPRNGADCNCSQINQTGTYISFDAGTGWDLYYYYDNCDCNCRCKCGKVICTKLHELGLLPKEIYEADQEFGVWLATNHPDVFNGYRAWADVCVLWMSGNGPNILPWIRDEAKRHEIMKNWSITWAQNVATPWANQIAGRKSITGAFLMAAGLPICKAVGMWQRVFGKSTKPAGFFTSVSIVAMIGLFKLVVDLGRLVERSKPVFVKGV